MSRGVRSDVKRKPVPKEVSIRSDGRAMDPGGTTAPPRQAAPARRAPAQGRYAGSPQHASLSPSEGLSMGYAASRSPPQEYRLRLLSPMPCRQPLRYGG